MAQIKKAGESWGDILKFDYGEKAHDMMEKKKCFLVVNMSFKLLAYCKIVKNSCKIKLYK